MAPDLEAFLRNVQLQLECLLRHGIQATSLNGGNPHKKRKEKWT